MSQLTHSQPEIKPLLELEQQRQRSEQLAKLLRSQGINPDEL